MTDSQRNNKTRFILLSLRDYRLLGAHVRPPYRSFPGNLMIFASNGIQIRSKLKSKFPLKRSLPFYRLRERDIINSTTLLILFGFYLLKLASSCHPGSTGCVMIENGGSASLDPPYRLCFHFLRYWQWRKKNHQRIQRLKLRLPRKKTSSDLWRYLELIP